MNGKLFLYKTNINLFSTKLNFAGRVFKKLTAYTIYYIAIYKYIYHLLKFKIFKSLCIVVVLFLVGAFKTAFECSRMVFKIIPLLKKITYGFSGDLVRYGTFIDSAICRADFDK
jgi:hypothetical protein